MSSAAPPTDTDTVTVRAMRADEQHAFALVAVRAFATNRVLRWINSIRPPGIPSPPADAPSTPLASLPREARLLYYFMDGLLRTTQLTKGRVMVAVDAEDNIRAFALWNRPGAVIDSMGMIVRAKQYRAILGDAWHPFGGWGLSGLRRALHVQSSFVKSHKKQLKARGVRREECWTLELLGTDPEHEGKGYAARLIREGLAFLGDSTPCVVESNMPRPKAIYECCAVSNGQCGFCDDYESATALDGAINLDLMADRPSERAGRGVQRPSLSCLLP
ncbi:hypothetical protein EXIGLDRAFT_422202 [Exidia glandulosa HHB12029]|uniref:N-acetyltransferase domain-containing protein n=1 Tax=Exidia glandulosa HHB12029 TaxID=1314781 RepID=A0A165BDV9_EXIGL|nr:hypothetical protein EXIGLDRAFT_422202 [Exidia glandulosa HHB12029]